LLEYRRTAWEERQEAVSWYDCNGLLPGLKEERPSLCGVHSQVLQDVGRRLDKAFKAFFRRVKAGEKPGYPRFKGSNRLKSFCYSQSGYGLTKDGQKLYLSKIGDVKIVLHRPLPSEPKRCIVKWTATGKWYASFVVEIDPEPLPPTGKTVGLDVGLTSFVTFSDGTKVDNPRFFRREEKTLAKVQRQMSKTKKGTSERTKCRKIVSRVHERIVNRRNDFSHKLSRRLVNEYDVIAFEDLNIKGMVRNHCLAKSISDAAWNQLLQCITAKAAEAGRVAVAVNPRNTSKACSRCGALVEKTLSDRVHECPHCGLVLDRDHNAAINILRLGLQSLASA